MMSFPPINELPPVLRTSGWSWEPYVTPSFPSYDFWVGSDPAGRRWLTKLHGDFYAYREIVFARLAQRMGWSCQSSTFMVLDERSAEHLGVPENRLHAAHWFLEEHPHKACSGNCPMANLYGHPINTVDDLVGSGVKHIEDWPKSEVAAALFGANEPPGRLFTITHEFVIIDSEQMFSTGPTDVTMTSWWDKHDGSPCLSGRQLTLEVCSSVGRLSDNDLAEALAIPNGVRICELWPVTLNLKASHDFARRFVAEFGKG